MENNRTFLFLRNQEEIEDFLSEYLYFDCLESLADDLFSFFHKKAHAIAINLKSFRIISAKTTEELINALNYAEECHEWHNNLRHWEMRIISDQLVLPSAVPFSEPQPAIKLTVVRDNDVERAAKRELREKILHNYDDMIHPDPRDLIRLLGVAQKQGYKLYPEYYEGESYYRNREY